LTDPNKSTGLANDDARLAAFLDGEMSETERARFLERLQNDSELRKRLESFAPSGPQIRMAFDELLNDAPVDAMAARLARALDFKARRPRFAWWTRAVAAAAIAGVIFASGFAASRWVDSRAGPETEDWRQTVAEYMELYSPETFRPTLPEALRAEASAVGDRLGLPLDPNRLQLTGLKLERIEMLQYDGAPLGQLGYVGEATLIAFCILRDGEADAPLATSMRGNFETATWAKFGRGYMVIGRAPPGKIAEVAGDLIRRF
jgi:anti-sigma factor RsiW